MAFGRGPSIVKDGLVLYLDAASSRRKPNSLRYKWWTTNGTNPTTKSGFDAFFTSSPNGSGIHNTSIDWVSLSVRPPYLPESSFAWEVSGFIYIDTTGNYIFNTRSDDGNELQINNQVVTSFFGGRGVPNPGDISSTITLSRGYYRFQYRMQQGGGGAGAQVRWQKPGSNTYEVIPASNFVVGLEDDIFYDLSGNENDGTLINGPTFDSDNLGSIEFDGVDDYADTGQKFNFNQSSQFSAEFWINFISHSDRPVAAADIFGKGHYYNNNWSIWLYNDHRIFFETTGDPTRQGIVYLSTSSLALNTWHYYVATYNNGLKSAYVNGILIGAQSYTGPGNFTNDNNVLIGRRPGDPSRSLRGNISSVKLYNRALTPEEILQNYNATKGRYGL